MTCIHSDKRSLLGMSLDEIHAIPNKESSLVIINTGAIEQHGPHLPVGMDSMIGSQWIKEIDKYIASKVALYVGPQISIGHSIEHLGFSGTLSISSSSLRYSILSIAEQLKEWGFLKMLILNSHGGNTSTIQYVLPEVRERLGMKAVRLKWDYYEPPVSKRELKYGMHAGEIETSLMYAFAKEHCAPDQANCEWIDEVYQARTLGLSWGHSLFGWKTSDLSKSGTMGDATQATEEKGRVWLEAYARAMAHKIEEVYFEVNASGR